MIMNTSLPYIILLALAVLLFTLVDPFMYWMPDATQMIAMTLAAGLLALFVGVVLREGTGDEREMQHRMYAGRAGYLSGIGVLTIALVLQGLTHSIDVWIPLALVVMVVAKLVARHYSDRNL